MPEFLFETEFIKNTYSLLNSGGYLLFNTMINSKAEQERNKQYLSHYNKSEFTTYSISKVEVYNELIVVRRD